MLRLPSIVLAAILFALASASTAGWQQGQALKLKTKTHLVFRVDVWDDTGDSTVEYVAGVDDLEVAEATYWAAEARWPAARITLRTGGF
jgi:hypothetical protein